MASKYVDKAFDELFHELRFMAEKLRLGEEIDLHRALEIIGLIDRNVDTIPWRGAYHYCCRNIHAAARKKGII